MTTDIKGFDERVRGIADNLTVTAATLNRAIADAGNTIPGSTAYAILNQLRMTLWALSEAAERLPTGLEKSLTDPSISVFDRDGRGKDHDPAAHIRQASEHIRTVHEDLRHAAIAAEAAQAPLSWQSWTDSQ